MIRPYLIPIVLVETPSIYFFFLGFSLAKSKSPHHDRRKQQCMEHISRSISAMFTSRCYTDTG